MPIYEYRCKQCEQKFDLMRRLDARDQAARCPNCGSRRTARVTIQPFAMLVGTTPDITAGEGEAGDFMGGGGEFGHDHGLDMGDEDWDF